MNNAPVLPTVIRFAPDRWGTAERFANLHVNAFPPLVRSCVTGTVSHFRRAQTLRRLAASLVGSMKEDRREVEAQGFSQATRSQEVAALVESTVTALYSSLDAARKIVTHTFENLRGFKDSTRATFQNAAAGKLDERAPEEIRAVFRDADWYRRFCFFRDALTHYEPGSCSLSEEDGKVRYFHEAVRDEGKTYVADVFAMLDGYFDSVNRFLGQLFSALSKTVPDDEVWQMCGIFSGLIYHRFVRPSEAVDFHSGRCDAHTWFDAPGKIRCPFAETCGAYQRRNVLSPVK